jgi:hypothetical protein
MTVNGARIGRALVRWLRRYLPAELVCTPCALLAGFAANQLTGSPAAAAVAATWGENLGFYGMMLGRELARRRDLRALPAIVRDLFIEFGPAEALDSFLLRPASIYAGLALVPHPALGMVAGKIAADLSFYTPAILTHELQRWYARRASSRRPRMGRLLLPMVGALVCLSLAGASLA